MNVTSSGITTFGQHCWRAHGVVPLARPEHLLELPSCASFYVIKANNQSNMGKPNAILIKLTNVEQTKNQDMSLNLIN